MTSTQRFRATIDLAGRTATGIRVPPEVVEGLGSHRQPPVRVTIRGHTYRTGLSYSRRQRHVLSIEAAKTPETRQRRIAKAVAMLREGRG